MLKKLFLILMAGLSFQNICPMLTTGANAGLNPNPELNFDKIELALEITDYFTESLKIATLGSISEKELAHIYFFSMINKILITGNEFWKLNLRSLLNGILESNKSSRIKDEFDLLIALFCSTISEVITAAWKGDIDSLGVFKFLSGFGYSIANAKSLINVKNIVPYNKNNLLPKLKREKLMQFGWLSFNKFMPIVIYTIAQLRKSDVGFNKYLFLTLGDQESKRMSSLYRYCSLAAGISELIRTYRQAKYTKIYDNNLVVNPKTS